MLRPLFDYSAAQLNEFFEKHEQDVTQLRVLENELQLRSTQAARNLLVQVRLVLEQSVADVNTPHRVDVALPHGQLCPSCGAAMKLRTAKKGPQTGSTFWGCSTYPTCKTIVSVGTEFTSEIVPPSYVPHPLAGRQQVSVDWLDACTRHEWTSEFAQIAALPQLGRDRYDSKNKVLLRSIGQSIVLTARERQRRPSEEGRLISALLIKLLQRGFAPLPTLRVEEQSIRLASMESSTIDFRSKGQELGWALKPGGGAVSVERLLSAIAARDGYKPAGILTAEDIHVGAVLGSPAECKFLMQWVPEHLGADAGHWFVPQASLDRLLEAHGSEGGGGQRVDFLFAHPLCSPIVIEIDGPEHHDHPDVDATRDSSLRAIGINVVRIPNHEVEAGDGPNLRRLWDACSAAFGTDRPNLLEQQLASLILDASDAAKLQFAIAKALSFGWLQPGGVWAVRVLGICRVVEAALRDALELLSALDTLYGASSTPDALVLKSADGTSSAFTRDETGAWVSTAVPDVADRELTICVDRTSSPYSEISSEHQKADIVIRPIFLPVDLSARSHSTPERQAIQVSDSGRTKAALQVFLQHIFRKQDFRPLQDEAITKTLQQKDSIVLLPTGSGKSIIYQLSGLLMPGVTLVVDPIVSLIEDQIEVLSQYGIDRAAGVTSALSSPEERKQMLRRVERGEYLFVLHSPERLQSRTFRQALRALAEISLVNLAVIDEAHCVSEWGHDFRPAYLNIGRNIRAFGSDRTGNPPPLLALTGTASRAVLRDVLSELQIDRNRSDAVLRPVSFDRPELSFRIVRSTGGDEKAVLRGILNSLPDVFGLPPNAFFQPAGRNTCSGVIFTPNVNGTHGVLAAVDEARSAANADVTFFSGKSPMGVEPAKWEPLKRRNVSSFKGNRTPILVATKAFGMGIDKPNIRYTIHYGMPSSLESFYQEAGRAGRDREPARCSVIFSEFDTDRSDALLDPAADLGLLKERYDLASRKTSLRDDITRALFFHLSSFSGIEADVTNVQRVLESLDGLRTATQTELPFWTDGDRSGQEKAIFRLTKIAVLSDYEVDFGAKKFLLHINRFDLERSAAALLDYAGASQPSRARAFGREVSEIREGEPEQLALALATKLIHFTYDIVERARRRSIQEAVLLARTAKSDADIRRRLIDYLQEGFGAERLDELLQQPDIDFSQWTGLIEKALTPIDAGELRGLTIRALESYPDHPGLLLTRGLVEALCSDVNESVCSQALQAFLRAALQDYDVGIEAARGAIRYVAEMASIRAPLLKGPLILTIFRLAQERILPPDFAQHARELARFFGTPETSAVVSTFAMAELVEKVSTAAERVANRWNQSAIRTTLEGAA